MALCRDCNTVIPCHCHVPPAVQIRPGVYLAGRPNREPFTPPAHYRRDDGVDCCVHTIPVGPDSCPHCRELHDDEQLGKEA